MWVHREANRDRKPPDKKISLIQFTEGGTISVSTKSVKNKLHEL